MSQWPRDEIVEDRIWRSGVEIVSHVNLTRIAGVRRALGVTGEIGGSNLLHRDRAQSAPHPRSLRAARPVRSRAA